MNSISEIFTEGASGSSGRSQEHLLQGFVVVGARDRAVRQEGAEPDGEAAALVE
jgi:hypothetical protein